MGKLGIIILWCCVIPGILRAQEINFHQDFEELTDTKPVDQKKWELCKRPYNSAWGSTDVRYSKTNVLKQIVRIVNGRGKCGKESV
ncbi:MAG: hypothetical protein V8S95_00475 [Odoribacter sp.]